MAARRPALAVQAFLEQLQLAVSSITHMPLRATEYEPGRPGAVVFPPPRELPLPGPGDWYLTLAINYVITRGENKRAPWRARTTSYYYELLQPADRRILAYHWHPEPPNRIVLPHLHVPQHTAPVDLSEAHMPTPRVALERANGMPDQPAMPSILILRDPAAWERYFRARYGAFYDEALAILARHDPMGWAAMSDNPREYASEVAGILSRLDEARSQAELRGIVYEEHMWWYGIIPGAGMEARYDAVARDLWASWQRYRDPE